MTITTEYKVPISTEETVKPVDIHRKRGTHCALGSGQGYPVRPISQRCCICMYL